MESILNNNNEETKNLSEILAPQTETQVNNPPGGDQKEIADKYLANISQKAVLTRQYSESKAILNDLKGQLTIDTIDSLKDRISEREKDIANLQSRINGLDQAADVLFKELTTENKEKYLKNPEN